MTIYGPQINMWCNWNASAVKVILRSGILMIIVKTPQLIPAPSWISSEVFRITVLDE